MNAKKIIFLSVVAITAGTATLKAQNADEIMKKHIEAMGGTDNWNKINSIKLKGNMSAQGMEIEMTQTTINHKATRMDISLMGQKGYSILTPTEGWAYMPFMPGGDKVTALPAEQVKGQQDQLNVNTGLMMDKSEYSKLEYIGRDTIDNIPCYKVKVTAKDGTAETAFFDATTYYLVREEMTMKLMDQEQEVALNYSNYQKQPEGIVYPMTKKTPQGDLIYKSIEINKPIDESVFKPDQTPSATDTKK
jgi:hypothetical protein